MIFACSSCLENQYFLEKSYHFFCFLQFVSSVSTLFLFSSLCFTFILINSVQMDPTPEEPNTSTSTGTGGASRRRLAFRPPTSSFRHASPVITTTSSAEADHQNTSTDGEMMQQEESLVEDSKEAPKRKTNPWSYDEVSAFFDAIKSVSKPLSLLLVLFFFSARKRL